jgi:hypothetical protein
LHFSPDIVDYTIATAWNYLVVSTATTPNAVTSIDKVVTSQANITLAGSALVAVELQSSAFLCTTTTYVISVVEVPLSIVEVNYGDSYLFPDYASDVYLYSLVAQDSQTSIDFTVESPEYTQCEVWYDNVLVSSSCNTSSLLLDVTQRPQAFVISLFVATDTVPFAVNYTFSIRKIGCFVTDLELTSSADGLSSCTVDDSVFPPNVTCVASLSRELLFSYAPFMSCPSQVSVSTSPSGPFTNCAPSPATSTVTTSCVMSEGLNYFQITVQDPQVSPTYFNNAADVSLTNGTFMNFIIIVLM